jgi:hypothetical protein
MGRLGRRGLAVARPNEGSAGLLREQDSYLGSEGEGTFGQFSTCTKGQDFRGDIAPQQSKEGSGAPLFVGGSHASIKLDNGRSSRLIYAGSESRRADSNRFPAHYECAVSGCSALQGFANTA